MAWHEDEFHPKRLALFYWYERVKPTGRSKDEWLQDRTAWEGLQLYIHSQTINLSEHNEIKSYITQLDKDGMLGAETPEEALETKFWRQKNIREFGTAEGSQGFVARVERMHNAMVGDALTQLYKEYISGDVWAKRATQYLMSNCFQDGGFVCEMCGKTHYDRAMIHVHHNQYSDLDGNESDQQLMACCAGLCHNLADIARKIQSGKVDTATINDALRPLFS